MGRHAPLPHTKENQRIGKQRGTVVENKVTQASADEHPEDRATRNKVADLFRWNH